MSKDIAKVWEFPSGSNPNKHYETLQYTDGSTSCNCMGWTRRVAADGTRSCKHTRSVDMGIADRECTTSHDYTQTGNRVAAPVKATPLAAGKAKTKKEEQVITPVRKILWNKG